MVKLEHAMTVQFPEMRSRLGRAVDALCDTQLQARLWIGGDRLHPSELGFDDTLLFLVDELKIFDTNELVGAVLVSEAELTAFTELTCAVEQLIEAIGKLGSFKDAQESGVPWSSCVATARQLQSLLGRGQ